MTVPPLAKGAVVGVAAVTDERVHRVAHQGARRIHEDLRPDVAVA